MGKPTVVVTTPKFIALTKRVATNFGLPQARICIVGHPLGGTSEETILQWGDAAVDDIIALFTT
jgi:hypothetical protein